MTSCVRGYENTLEFKFYVPCYFSRVVFTKKKRRKLLLRDTLFYMHFNTVYKSWKFSLTCSLNSLLLKVLPPLLFNTLCRAFLVSINVMNETNSLPVWSINYADNLSNSCVCFSRFLSISSDHLMNAFSSIFLKEINWWKYLLDLVHQNLQSFKKNLFSIDFHRKNQLFWNFPLKLINQLSSSWYPPNEQHIKSITIPRNSPKTSI